MNESKFVCYIPARGWSRRLPRKNFLPFVNGRSLVEVTIKQALNCGLFRNIVIDTDSENELSSLKAKFPSVDGSLRCSHLAGDQTDTVTVLQGAIQRNKEIFQDYDVVVMQPTSPLRRFESLSSALDYFVDESLDLLVSVSDTIINPNDIIFFCGDKVYSMKNLCETPPGVSQYYFETGQFYVASQKRLIEGVNALKPRNTTELFRTNPLDFVDIDYDYQFRLAQLLYNEIDHGCQP